MSYEYERVITPSSGLRLHLNENTAGCSPRVLAALHALTREQAAFYPDYSAAVTACAARLGVGSDDVLLTNGLDEGILAAAVCAVRDRSLQDPEALIVVPAFDMYAACADAAGARVVEIPANRNFDFPLEGVLRAVSPRTRIVFVTTPHNPTGRVIERSSVLQIAAAAPQALIFVDEAYADFAGATFVGSPDVRPFANVVIGRTFAKAYGLAALRIGALVGHPATLAPIRRIVPPYSLNVCASVALCAALADTAYYEWYVAQVRASRTLLSQAFDRLGVRYWPSAANFVLADFGRDAGRVVQGLAIKGVHVRDRSRDPLCPGCVRITTGIVEHTRTCIGALEEVLCGAAS